MGLQALAALVVVVVFWAIGAYALVHASVSRFLKVLLGVVLVLIPVAGPFYLCLPGAMRPSSSASPV
ncbi:Uncharacterized protein PBTT_00562 [Plasmodiophora brassicae]